MKEKNKEKMIKGIGNKGKENRKMKKGWEKKGIQEKSDFIIKIYLPHKL